MCFLLIFLKRENERFSSAGLFQKRLQQMAKARSQDFSFFESSMCMTGSQVLGPSSSTAS